MKSRKAVRILLLDPSDRLLLMRLPPEFLGDLTLPKLSQPFWITVGGGIEPGETIHSAAARELREETGQTNARIGPVVWHGEHIFEFKGEPVLFREWFVAARTERTEVSSDFWEEEEKLVIQEMRWWTLAEVRATSELIFPPVLRELVSDIAQGRHPDPPLRISLA